MNGFIKPENIIAQVALRSGDRVADFGCGSGFYTIPAAKAVGASGLVYAFDLLDEKLSATLSAARGFGLHNVKPVRANLELPLSGVEPLTFDMVLLGNILHQVRTADAVLRNAYGLLKTEGRLVAIEWKPGNTPFGPAPEKRLSESTLASQLEKFHFKKLKNLEVDGYHYAVIFQK
ncbi:MAG TPA: methyltransferase domain-containing protein [Patescibacteria group bacterium]|nr:methyltransferase domain-containing protein [Patescibacteria group bacterium]